ncbi:MAG: HRDC domain-containing protein, partial [Oscillospiraceae bacterium]|nr:HRDC domain-containing protein [Oscillospiraceae bacterium]
YNRQLISREQDVPPNRFLIENSDDNPEMTEEMRAEVRERDLQRLKEMTFYSTTSGCLREFILRYFGERSPSYCGNCSNCNANFETVDITVEAQKIVSCVYRVNASGRSFGRSMIADILNGSKRERVISLGFDKLSTYGIMSDMTQKRIVKMIDFLIENGWLALDGDEYAVVKTTPKSAEIVRGRTAVEMKLEKEAPPAEKKPVADYGVNTGLFGELRKLRSEFAAAEKVPAYIIFSDAALKDMCRKLPVNEEEFLTVSGVGRKKAERYGEVFCTLIEQYAAEHPEIKSQHTAV